MKKEKLSKEEIIQKLSHGEKTDSISYAKYLRMNLTEPELELWNLLKTRKEKFYRQYPIGPYIVDFICRKYKFVIEIDGPQHKQTLQYDKKRDFYLKQEKGLYILRITADFVMNFPDAVMDKIDKCIYFLDIKKRNKIL